MLHFFSMIRTSGTNRDLRVAWKGLKVGVSWSQLFCPPIFSISTLSLGDLSPFHYLKYHLYVNDSQIYITLTFPDLYMNIKLPT